MKHSRAVAVLCAARRAFHHIGAEARDIFNEAFVASALRSRTFYGYEICAVPGERVNKKGLRRATADRAARTILGRAAPAAGRGGPRGRGRPRAKPGDPGSGDAAPPANTGVCDGVSPVIARAHRGRPVGVHPPGTRRVPRCAAAPKRVSAQGLRGSSRRCVGARLHCCAGARTRGRARARA